MDSLHHELSVLAKAIHYKNLSTASENIGLSQPQLSRIVARIEKELETSLLDRTSKRRSGWTATAHSLVEVYLQNMLRFTQDIQHVVEGARPKFLKIATLEGLIPIANQLSHQLLTQTELEGIELNALDLSELEERFGRQEYDLAFTSRTPGKKKYPLLRELGHQQIKRVTGSGPFSALSTYEHSLLQAKAKTRKSVENGGGKIFVSNLLFIREHWIQNLEASGALPSPLMKGRPPSKNHPPVLLMAQDEFSPSFWALISELKFDS